MVRANRPTGARSSGTNGGWSKTKSRYGIAPPTMRIVVPNQTPSSYSRMACSPSVRSSWKRPTPREKTAIAATARGFASAARPRGCGTFAGGPWLFLQQTAEENGELVEDEHRHRHPEERERVVARCHDGGHEAEHDYRHPAPLPPFRRRHDPRDHEEDNDYRVKENGSKNKANEKVQRDVRGERITRCHVGPGNVDQPGKSLGPHQDRGPYPETEQ